MKKYFFRLCAFWSGVGANLPPVTNGLTIYLTAVTAPDAQDPVKYNVLLNGFTLRVASVRTDSTQPKFTRRGIYTDNSTGAFGWFDFSAPGSAVQIGDPASLILLK